MRPQLRLLTPAPPSPALAGAEQAKARPSHGSLRQLQFCLFCNKLCIYWLCWVFVAAWAFSSCSKRGPLVEVYGLLAAAPH